MMRRIGIVAGEPSGDFLGGGLIQALRRSWPELRVEGVGGTHLALAGCRNLASMERLAVMGIVEVLGRFLELYRLRRQLIEHFLSVRPDVFIGVDAPDFNLDLEVALRNRGIKTVHYVSPSVWAWRQNRMHKISSAVDLVLVLFPFEQEFYRRCGVHVAFVGHPLADQISLEPDRAAARRRLGLAPAGTLVAVMPGSRRMELERHLPPFLQAADWVRKRRADVSFISSVLSEDSFQLSHLSLRTQGLTDLPLAIYQNRAHDVLEAADVALLASGTVTLEAMLFKRPMVVGYRINWLSYRLIRSMVNVRFVAIPNLLAGAEVVPECLQDDCTPERLGTALLRWLENPDAVAVLRRRFDEMHRQLRRNANESAAGAVWELVQAP